MRLWSLHPQYLDSQGLVALWRDGLLAQKVLAGNTKGYKNHPQLLRFRETTDPLVCIGHYLHHVAAEASTRSYKFDESKILQIPKKISSLPLTRGQLHYEFQHLLNKLKARKPSLFKEWEHTKKIRIHPAFHLVPGGIADWEKTD